MKYGKPLLTKRHVEADAIPFSSRAVCLQIATDAVQTSETQSDLFWKSMLAAYSLVAVIIVRSWVAIAG